MLACSATLFTPSNSDPDPGRANNTTGPGAAASLKVNKVAGVLRPNGRESVKRSTAWAETIDGDDDNEETQVDQNDTKKQDAQMAHTHTHNEVV